jgi:hypothetical protein
MGPTIAAAFGRPVADRVTAMLGGLFEPHPARVEQFGENYCVG